MEAAQYLREEYRWQKEYTPLSKKDFLEWWNDQMFTRYAIILEEKEAIQRRMISRIMLVYKKFTVGICFVISEFLRPGPPPVPVIRGYVNPLLKCKLCGDYLEHTHDPCFTCGSVFAV